MSDTGAANNAAANRPPCVARVLGHPVVTGTSLLLNILALVLALLGYIALPHRKLAYTTNPVRTVVVQSDTPSELEVSFRGKSLRGTNVVGLQVSVWNRGTQSIRSSDVLEPVEIRLIPTVPILAAQVTKASREVTGFELKQDTELMSQGRLGLSWRILEPNDGGNVQVFYAGPPDVEAKVLGVIEGHEVPRGYTSERIPTPQERFAFRSFKDRVAPFLAVCFGVAVVLQMYTELRRAFAERNWRAGVVISFWVLMLSLLVYSLLYEGVVEPPFGF